VGVKSSDTNVLSFVSDLLPPSLTPLHPSSCGNWGYPLSGKELFFVSMIIIPILMILGLIFPEGKRDLIE